MRDTLRLIAGLEPMPVLVLGTDDIASAVGHALASAGFNTLLARDPDLPVLRRALSFDDALDFGSARLDGVTGYALDPPFRYAAAGRLGLTTLEPDALLNPALIEGVIDARMHRREEKPDLRGGLGFAIGLGPGFRVGGNVDIAIETAPEATGRILRRGETIAAHGKSAPLGSVGRERFGRAPCGGIWRTHHNIGDAVEAGTLVGLCGGAPIEAPGSGCLRGLVQHGSPVRSGMRLLEVDPRGPAAQWSGIPPRAVRIAAATLTAVRELMGVSRPALRPEVVSWLA